MARGIPMSLRLQDEMSPEQLAALRHAEFAGINAKPSDLSRANAAGIGQPQQQGSMDNYIDHVLQMSGMTQGQQVPVPTAQPGEYAGNPATAPVPGARPSMDNDTDTPPDGDQDDAALSAADNSGASLGQLAAAVAGGSGLALLGKYLMQKYMSGDTSGLPDQSGAAAKTSRASPIDETIAAIDGEQPKQIAAPLKQLEAPRKQITDQSQQKLLPAPPQQPAPTDPSQMTADDIDAVFRNRVEGSDGMRPSQQNRFSAPATDPRAQVIEQAKQMSPRDAVAFLQQNGIQIDDSLLQQLVENSDTANAARGAVRRVLR